MAPGDETEVLERIPEIIRTEYGIAIRRHELVRISENLVVKVEAEGGDAFGLRIRRTPGIDLPHFTSELVFLRDLSAATGLAVPAPVATRDGRLHCVVPAAPGPCLGSLFRWMRGTHVDPGAITGRQAAQMGAAVAALHAFSSRYAPPAGFSRPRYDAAWYFGRQSWKSDESFLALLDPDHLGHLRELDREVESDLGGRPTSPDTFGLIHYDLHAGNFLFEKDEARMIDFDECGFGFHLFDLAHILFELAEHPRPRELAGAVREAYARTRGIAAIPEDDLRLFIRLQGIAYMNWLYRRFRRDGDRDARASWVARILGRLAACSG